MGDDATMPRGENRRRRFSFDSSPAKGRVHCRTFDAGHPQRLEKKPTVTLINSQMKQAKQTFDDAVAQLTHCEIGQLNPFNRICDALPKSRKRVEATVVPQTKG